MEGWDGVVAGNFVPWEPFLSIQQRLGDRVRSGNWSFRYGGHSGGRFLAIWRDEGLLPGSYNSFSIRLVPKAEGLGLVRGGMVRFSTGRGRVKIVRGGIADSYLLRGPEHGPRHRAFIPETDFGLGWVRVYVHSFRRQIHEQDDLRVFLGKEAPLVDFADGVQDDLVVDDPVVGVEQHPVTTWLGLSGRGGQSVDTDATGGTVE